MSKPHKYANSHIKIDTRLSADRIAELTKSVGENTAAVGLNIWRAAIRFEGAELGRTNFSIRGIGNFSEMIAFHVNIVDTPTGSTARSEIENYKTTQQTVMFIPVTPKDMVGYSAYRKFMNKLSEAVLAEDSAARISIVEREGR